jgi:5-methylcytosine-specific restriction endonuclease McrA
MKEQILKLKEEGKTYRQIESVLGCSKSLISYYCSEGQKEKLQQRTTNYRKNDLKTILHRKLSDFMCITGHTKNNKIRSEYTFNSQDLINKFGESPKCYLTGVNINLMEPSTYHFDHIIPRSRGGSNEISNLGLATKEANETKHDRTLEELKVLCKQILKNI